MNDVLKNLTEADLAQAINELEDWNSTGVLVDGLVREIDLSLQIEFSGTNTLFYTQTALYRLAAIKWLNHE